MQLICINFERIYDCRHSIQSTRLQFWCDGAGWLCRGMSGVWLTAKTWKFIFSLQRFFPSWFPLWMKRLDVGILNGRKRVKFQLSAYFIQNTNEWVQINQPVHAKIEEKLFDSLLFYSKISHLVVLTSNDAAARNIRRWMLTMRALKGRAVRERFCWVHREQRLLLLWFTVKMRCQWWCIINHTYSIFEYWMSTRLNDWMTEWMSGCIDRIVVPATECNSHDLEPQPNENIMSACQTRKNTIVFSPFLRFAFW